MREFSIGIEIAAPASSVWEVLVDFQSYSDWNPMLSVCHGTLHEGSDLLFELAGEQDARRSVHARIDRIEKERALVLSRSVFHPLFAHLVHSFELVTPSESRTRFTQRWQCSGVLVPVLWTRFTAGMAKFEAFSSALKHRVEASRIGP